MSEPTFPQKGVWPLPELDGRRPVVLERTGNDSVELAYARLEPNELATIFRPDTANGTATHFMPDFIPVFAADDATVAYAGTVSVILDHGDGWATHYSNLVHVLARPTHKAERTRTERVSGGDIIGYVGGPAPRLFQRLRFAVLRFELDAKYRAVDPALVLDRWTLRSWSHATTQMFPPLEAR